MIPWDVQHWKSKSTLHPNTLERDTSNVALPLTRAGPLYSLNTPLAHHKNDEKFPFASFPFYISFYFWHNYIGACLTCLKYGILLYQPLQLHQNLLNSKRIVLGEIRENHWVLKIDIADENLGKYQTTDSLRIMDKAEISIWLEHFESELPEHWFVSTTKSPIQHREEFPSKHLTHWP